MCLLCWHAWGIDVFVVLTCLRYWCVCYADMLEVLMCLLCWCDWGIDVFVMLTCLRYWCVCCADVVEVLMCLLCWCGCIIYVTCVAARVHNTSTSTTTTRRSVIANTDHTIATTIGQFWIAWTEMLLVTANTLSENAYCTCTQTFYRSFFRFPEIFKNPSRLLERYCCPSWRFARCMIYGKVVCLFQRRCFVSAGNITAILQDGGTVNADHW